jgi:thiamine-phosphate pyrophosphorylase
MKILSPLMAIVDADLAARLGWTMTGLAAAYLSGGATLLQLRAKQASSGWLLDTATTIVSLAHRASATVIVNDRADIARLSGADGVHVGQEDLGPLLVRRIFGPGDIDAGPGDPGDIPAGVEAIVGLSTHTPEQLEAALDAPVSYIAIGPVFGTETKTTGYASVGLEAVRRAASRTRARGLPLVAIGGVTLETAPEIIRAGATTVAVISDLVAGGDPAARVRAYLSRLTV